MSRTVRTIAVAVALATICIAPVLEELLRPSRDQLFHWSGNPSALFGPPLVELVVLSVLLAAVLISAERPGYWRAVVWSAMVVYVPSLIIHQLFTIWPSYVPHWLRVPPHLLLLVLWPLLAVVGYRFARRQSEAVIETVSTVLAFTALSTVLFLFQLLWFWWLGRDLNKPVALHAATTSAQMEARPRIIWIVLDELSYQQVYEHRYTGLQLPAFDALAADATVFTDVAPTSDRTEKAIPALLSGHPVQQMASTRGGGLRVRSSSKAQWDRFDERDTVFEDALHAGYKTAIAGWYNPYCRMLPDVLDYCYWTYANSTTSFSGNLLVSSDTVMNAPAVRSFLRRLLHVPKQLGESEDEAQLDDYLRLKRIGDDVLQDRSMTFAFLHLPIPHPDGIYNRRTGKLKVGGTYLDNLVLADQWLAQARALLEATGQWDSSTVIVMGDHGWRTQLIWETYGHWTDEEQRASQGGQFDPRPGYIVKLAGQQTGQEINEPFDAIRTRALVDELMAGRIHSAEDLKSWVDDGGQAGETLARTVRQ